MHCFNSLVGHEVSGGRKKKKKPPHVKWMNDLINERAACSGRACRQENKCKPKCLFVFFHNVFCRLLLLSYFSQMESFEPNPGPGAGPLGSRRPNAGIHRSAANLFVPVFVSLIVCVYTHFCPWPSRVFSPTLAIFCLVAPNMPLCISAVRTQLIYIRLHLLEVTTENYIYFKRADITH